MAYVYDGGSSDSGDDVNILDGVPPSGGTKRGRKATGDAVVDAMMQIAAAIMNNEDKFSISKCINGLDEMQGLDERIYFFALDLFENHRKAREVFISLKGEKRLPWLQGKFGVFSNIETASLMMDTKETTPQLYLPHELIIQILLRLPVKSLLRFKSVCKSWFSLISDPQFANSHFQITDATHTHRVLFISKSPQSIAPYFVFTPEARSVDFEASLHHSASISPNIDFLLPEACQDLGFEIKGSCRGIILLRCKTKFQLWNPSTGFHKQIPLSPNDDNSDFFGFGYDKSTDDYLVISMSICVMNEPLHLYFFSLRANAWKQIETETTHIRYSDPDDTDVSGVGLFFNGAIHWFAQRHGHALKEYVIVVFDLTEKKLLEMHLPHDFHTKPFEWCRLWVFGEFLGLWSYNDTMEIWVMNEYKLDSSWTKMIVCSFDPVHIHDDLFFPLCSTKSGDIVSLDGNWSHGLAKYDYKGQLLDYHFYYDRDDAFDHGGFKVAVYTESLISLHNGQA